VSNTFFKYIYICIYYTIIYIYICKIISKKNKGLSIRGNGDSEGTCINSQAK